MKIINYVLFLSILFYSCNLSKKIELRTGDLLFQDLDCGALCDAIENATLGQNGERFSHIGIVERKDDEIYVIEAYDGVSKTPINVFLNRDLKPNEKSRVVVGRLKSEYHSSIPNAIKEANKRIGLAYDNEFKLNNNKYYCSEFIYDIFKNNSKSLFKVKAMTFVNKKTNTIDSAWIKHFKKLNIPIPEDHLGCNPIDYYQSEKLTILGFVVN